MRSKTETQMDNSKFRCTLPFSHLHITSRGIITPCCNFEWQNVPEFVSNIERMREGDHSLELPWITNGAKNTLNSKLWYELKKRSSKNMVHPGCSNCYFSEKSTGKSRRTWANSQFPKGDSSDKILSMELKLGAKCNLACRTCSYTSSNKLLKENSIERFGEVNKDWMKHIQSLSEWVHDDIVWDEIKSLSHDLEYIQFTGGEPLLIQEHYEFLEYLIQKNINPKVQYITNGTIAVDDEKKKIWDNLDYLVFDFSIDGIGELGEYVRTGSTWEEQVANIKSFFAYKKERTRRGQETYISIATTVSILNIVGVKDIVDFIYDEELELSAWTINIVRHPEYLDIANLTGKAKDHAVETVNQIINSNRYHDMYKTESQILIDRMNSSLQHDYVTGIKQKDNYFNITNKNKINYARLMPDWWNKLVDNT